MNSRLRMQLMDKAYFDELERRFMRSNSHLFTDNLGRLAGGGLSYSQLIGEMKGKKP